MKNWSKIYSDRCLGLRMKRIERYVSRVFDAELRSAGLNISQLSLLSAIAQMPGAAPSQLSQFLDIEKSSLSRNLEFLELEGWIITKRGPSGRLIQLSISKAG